MVGCFFSLLNPAFQFRANNWIFLIEQLVVEFIEFDGCDPTHCGPQIVDMSFLRLVRHVIHVFEEGGGITPLTLLHLGGDQFLDLRNGGALRIRQRLQHCVGGEHQLVPHLVDGALVHRLGGRVHHDQRIDHVGDREEPFIPRGGGAFLHRDVTDERLHHADVAVRLLKRRLTRCRVEQGSEGRRVLQQMPDVPGLQTVRVRLDRPGSVHITHRREQHQLGELLRPLIRQHLQCRLLVRHVELHDPAILQLDAHRTLRQLRQVRRHLRPGQRCERGGLRTHRIPEAEHVGHRDRLAHRTCQIRRQSFVMCSEEHVVHRRVHTLHRVRADTIRERLGVTDRPAKIRQLNRGRPIVALALHLGTDALLGPLLIRRKRTVQPEQFSDPILLPPQFRLHVGHQCGIRGHISLALHQRLRHRLRHRRELRDRIQGLLLRVTSTPLVTGAHLVIGCIIVERQQLRPTGQPHIVVVDLGVQLVQALRPRHRRHEQLQLPATIVQRVDDVDSLQEPGLELVPTDTLVTCFQLILRRGVRTHIPFGDQRVHMPDDSGPFRVRLGESLLHPVSHVDMAVLHLNNTERS